MLTFGHPEGGSHTEPNFPNFEFWHTNKNACISEGERVLKVLALRGDKREWYAAGFPDPFMVGSGRHPADSWFISISNLP